MATDKKRVMFYVDPEVKAEIEAVAEDLGCSVSALCGDMVTTALPQLREVAKALKYARTDPDKALKMLQGSVTNAQADLLDQFKDASRG